MSLTRFSVSLEESLMRQFDAKIKAERCPTRSKAVGDLIRASLVQTEWQDGEEVAGAIVLVYDHHTSNIVKTLTQTQHDGHAAIISTQHVHLDHHNCLETIVLRGKPQEIQQTADQLVSLRGVKLGKLVMGHTGQGL